MSDLMLELAKVFAVEAYKDVASPIAKQIGVTLEEVAKFILAPVYYPTRHLNHRIENWFFRIDNDIKKENYT